MCTAALHRNLTGCLFQEEIERVFYSFFIKILTYTKWGGRQAPFDSIQKEPVPCSYSCELILLLFLTIFTMVPSGFDMISNTST